MQVMSKMFKTLESEDRQVTNEVCPPLICQPLTNKQLFDGAKPNWHILQEF